jgi:hypothetical protein
MEQEGTRMSIQRRMLATIPAGMGTFSDRSSVVSVGHDTSAGFVRARAMGG